MAPPRPCPQPVSPPFSWILTRRPIEAMRSVCVEAKKVQYGVQARPRRLCSAAGNPGGHARLDEHDQRAVQVHWSILACCSAVGRSIMSSFTSFQRWRSPMPGTGSLAISCRRNPTALAMPSALRRAHSRKSAPSACDHSNAVATRASIDFRSAGQPATGRGSGSGVPGSSSSWAR